MQRLRGVQRGLGDRRRAVNSDPYRVGGDTGRRKPGGHDPSPATVTLRRMGSTEKVLPTGVRTMLTLASFVVVVGGMKAASTIVVPIIAAIFVAVVSIPPTAALVRLGIRRWLATLIVFLVVMLVGLATAALVTTAATAFANDLPRYQTLLQEKVDGFVIWLQSKGANISADQIDDVFDPNLLFPFIQSFLASLVGLLQDTVFVLLTVVFILMEATAIPAKIRMLVTQDAEDATIERWKGVLRDLQGYLVVKTCTSLVTGVLTGFGCWMLGLPYALVFGLIAFGLNYVPSLGSIIAAIPPVLVAIVLEGPGTAAAIASIYVAVNIVIGSLVEPRIMGRRMGLSPLVVFLSLVFWGFILGPVGMFLSVPLTMIVKILLEGTEDLKWIAVVLGSGDAPATLSPHATEPGP